MKVRIRGKQWNFVRAHTGPKSDGHCDPPEDPNRRIIVHSGLRGQKELEVIIHEMLHAAVWDLDEEAVASTAADIAEVLWRQKYRKQEKK